MHIVRSLVCVHRFKINHVPHNRELVGNSVTAMHITGMARDLQRLTAIVTFDQTDHFRGHLVCVKQLPDTECRLKSQSDLRLHICQFLLEKLRLS